MTRGSGPATVVLIALGGCCLTTNISSGTSAGFIVPITSSSAGASSTAAAASSSGTTGQPLGSSSGTGTAGSSGTASGGSSTGSSSGATSGATSNGGGTGLFFPAVNYPLDGSPHALTTFQDDGGFVGLATADYSDGLVFVFSGDGDGTFHGRGPVFVAGNNGLSLQSICSADFNNDGLADLAISSWQGAADNLGLLFGSGTGSGKSKFSVADGNLDAGATYQIISADVDNDGFADLLVIVGGDLYVGRGRGDGGFSWDPPLTNLGYMRGVAVGNFGANDLPQIAVVDNQGNQVEVLAQVDGGFSPYAAWDAGNQPVGVAAADFNGDGCQDLAVANNLDANLLTIFVTPCAGHALQSYSYPSECSFGQWLVTADFDGDGHQDVAVACDAAGYQGQNVALFLGRGDGTFRDPLYYVADQGPSWIVTADFNGDGKPDLAISNLQSEDVSVLIHR